MKLSNRDVRAAVVCVAFAALAGCDAGGTRSEFNPAPQLGISPGRANALVSKMPAEKVVYNFLGGADGSFPQGGLMIDATGVFYGTTSQGGGSTGAGTVFRLEPVGKRYSKTIVYTFLGGSDGQDPLGALITDNTGALYGTTYNGGSDGDGIVFKLTPAGSGFTKSILYNFRGGSDGANPNGALVANKYGVLYGTTTAGGAAGAGTVFRLKPTGSGYTESIVYSFTGGQDGATPRTALLPRNGDFYSTTLAGGGGPCALQGSPTGCGTVFELKRSGRSYSETVIYRFKGGKDGAFPYAALVQGSHRTLYGTTGDGGTKGCRAHGGFVGCGTVFKLTPSPSGYVETVLYRFKGGADGFGPLGTLTPAPQGQFYGTTLLGGSANQGTVFVLTPVHRAYRHQVLYSFQATSKNDGAGPTNTLVFNANGALFGTTQGGGTATAGTVFKVIP